MDPSKGEVAKIRGVTHYYVAKLSERRASELEIGIPRECVATFNDIFSNWIETFAKDLESFAQHRTTKVAKKTKTINTDDVLLFARRNAPLLEELKKHADLLNTEEDKEKELKKSKKRPRKVEPGEDEHDQSKKKPKKEKKDQT